MRYFEAPGLIAYVIDKCTEADIKSDWEEISLSLFNSTNWKDVNYLEGSYKPTVIDGLIAKNDVVHYYVHHESNCVLVDYSHPGDLCEEITKDEYDSYIAQGYSSTSISEFIQFMHDPDSWDMYITGAAGTGKTYLTSTEVVPWCQAHDINVTVCAFTHRACDVLAEKMPAGVKICTLHSLLKKRPMINVNATQIQHLQMSKVSGKAEPTELIVIDEYGMVGERDLQDLRLLQDPGYQGVPRFKILWLGDPNQLPPVGDVQAVRPEGRYQVRLTEIKRTKEAPLLKTLSTLVSFIEGRVQPHALEPHSCFIRGQNILVKPKPEEVLLAYTNARVQELNQHIAKRSYPVPGDTLFSPTTHKLYTFIEEVEKPDEIQCPYSGRLARDSKYKTLEYIEHTYSFALVKDEDDEEYIVAYIFGHSDYNKTAQAFKQVAAESNQAIESAHRNVRAAVWAKANSTNKLARARAKAWRDFLAFDECVMCLDFPYARTVHKSQGSTFDTVYLDMEDLYSCAERDFKLYLRLLYVAISRARYKVITN